MKNKFALLLIILVSGSAYADKPFKANGTGAVSRPVPEKLKDSSVSVCDFEIPCPNGTDDTAAIQAALTSSSASGGATGKNILIPSGIYIISSQLVFNRLVSIRIQGDGNRNTILRYTGTDSGIAFLFRNDYRLEVEGIRFDAPGKTAVTLADIRQDSGQSDYDSSASSNINTFRNCTFKNGDVNLAIDFATSDIMNDSHIFEHNIFDTATTANISITGANAMGLSFKDNIPSAAPYGVQVNNPPGSFKWYGGNMHNTTANFNFVAAAGDGYIIQGVRSESTPRFILFSSGSSTGAPMLLNTISYSAASLNADGDAISANGGGPWTIIGGQWGGQGGVESAIPRFTIAAAQPTTVAIINNGFGTPGADVSPPLRSSTGNRLIAYGNRYKNAGLTYVTKAEEVTAAAARTQTITYTSGVAMAIDASAAESFKVVVNDTAAFSFTAPTNGVAGQKINLQIKATAALNASNPFSGAGWRAGTWTALTNGNSYLYEFYFDGTSWFQKNTTVAVAN